VGTVSTGGAVGTDVSCAKILDAADGLFYAHGIQAVSVDQVRAASGVSLKRLYQCFSSKQDLVEAYLRRRDERWRAALAAHVGQSAPPDRPLAVFDWLRAWLAGPGARGCAFINSFGELGATETGVARAARDHKQSVLEYLTALAADLDVAHPEVLAEQLLLLVDGAITTAAISGNPDTALRARTAAETLVAAAKAAERS
jgi:AcrR family transcriptional regulator